MALWGDFNRSKEVHKTILRLGGPGGRIISVKKGPNDWGILLSDHRTRQSTPIWCSLILLLALHTIFYFSGLASRPGDCGDVGSYMRLYQVLELHDHGGWYDSVYHRSNAPYGELRQWTRPLDVLLYAGALPLSIFSDFQSALAWWGWLIGPILHIAALIALFWAE